METRSYTVTMRRASLPSCNTAENVATAVSTCARCRLFGTADEENLKLNVNPCSARRLRAVGLGLASMSETVGCRRVRDTCCSFVRNVLQPTPSASLGLALRTIASGTACHFATDRLEGPSLCCVGTLDRRGRAGMRAVASSGTVCSRRRARAWSSTFVQGSTTSVGHGAHSSSDVRMYVVVASGTRVVGSFGTAYGRRRLRDRRLGRRTALERFAAVASEKRAAVDSSGTVNSRGHLRTKRLAPSVVWNVLLLSSQGRELCSSGTAYSRRLLRAGRLVPCAVFLARDENYFLWRVALTLGESECDER